MTTPESDPLRLFSNALSPAARSHLRLDFHTIPMIRKACDATTPRELAKTVGQEIGWRSPANPWPLMWHRIRRAAGVLDHENEDQEATS